MKSKDVARYVNSLASLGSDALNVTDNELRKRTICAALDVAMKHGIGSINTALFSNSLLSDGVLRGRKRAAAPDKNEGRYGFKMH